MRKNWWEHFYSLSTKPQTVYGIGLMSGTSLDGLDIALVQLNTEILEGKGPGLSLKSFSVLAFETFFYEPDFQASILKAMQGSASNLAHFNTQFGEKMGQAVLTFLEKQQFSAEKLSFIASHGQTVYHEHQTTTLQLGEADKLAKITKVPVVFDFRQGDLAVGGSGAPLVVFFDSWLVKDRNQNLAFQNLGGIANFTFLPPKKNQPGRAKGLAPVLAMDTGPANLMSNLFTFFFTQGKEFYDHNGQYAKKGRLQKELLDWFFQNSHQQTTTKQKKLTSTGHENFGKSLCEKALKNFPLLPLEDFIHTSLLFSAQTLAKAYQQHIKNLDAVYITGGGAKNPILLKNIQTELEKIYKGITFTSF